jgi:polyhydroxyalkanoate synthase
VYALNLLVDSAVSFCLTNGGHNSGILSEPGHAGRHYRLGLRRHGARYSGPEAWFERTEPNEGSWWPAWAGWLAEHSGDKRKPKTPGATLCPAPGDYVLG